MTLPNEHAEAGPIPFAPVELLPVHCAVGASFILAWVVSTPLRNVGWAFFVEVGRVLSLNCSLWNECLHQYQDVLRNEEVRQLSGVTYIYALWGAVFAVPMQVLTINEEQYGDYGRMLRHWWVAAYSTFHEYLPDLFVNTVHSVGWYARVTRAATVACGRRVFEIVRVVLLTCRFVVAMIFFAPMALYDLVEFCLLGELGVAVTLLTLNCVNYYQRWTLYGLPLSVMVVAEGLVAHLWRNGKSRKEREKYSPVTVVLDGLEGLRARAAARERVEADNLRRLQGATAAEGFDTFQDAADGTEEFNDDEMPVRAPAAISAELRAAEERSALLRHELALHPDVRRGRRTLSRGDVPCQGTRALCQTACCACVVPLSSEPLFRAARSRNDGASCASLEDHRPSVGRGNS